MLSCFRGVLVAALGCAACGAPLMKLPAGPGGPAADAKDALAEATSACRAVSTISAELGVSGSVGGHRLRGRLLAGLAPPASARLEAVAPFGQPLFILVSRDGDATLLLPRDNRVLEHGRSDRVLEAVAGVPLDAADLRTALIGCAVAPDAERAQQYGADWRVVPDGPTEVYLHRDGRAAPWRIVATTHHASTLRDPQGRPAPGRGTTESQGVGDWRAEYGDFQNGLPRSVRFRSSDPERFDLRLSLSQVDLNVSLGADVFRVQVPRGADPITLEELKQSGPLGARPNNARTGS